MRRRLLIGLPARRPARNEDRDARARLVSPAARGRLTCVFALQVFVIVGGVTKADP